MKENDTSTEIRRAALNMLARRDYSPHELFQKLKTKGYSRDLIEPVIADLAKSGFINESRYTENFIHSRRNKGYGPERITMELQGRGIADETIAEHLQITDNAWFTEARKVWQKHFKGKQPNDFNDRAKQMRFLQYRGFTREQIKSVFGNEEYE